MIIDSSLKKQSKVSMVIPCYNKVDGVAVMFDSILAQNWDNIELILVNDGSTDGTREMISTYEPKFRKRGYEVIIIDQENAGVCAAGKAGLERVTGDYVCMVDADDELSPVYVSTMAGWLDFDADCDYCVCGGMTYTGSGMDKLFIPDWFRWLHYDAEFITEKYLMHTIRSTVWIYMLRVDYLRKCNILDTYYTATKGSHEPGYIIPILAYGGKYMYLPLPLYHFNGNDEGHSRSTRYERMFWFYTEYNKLCKIAIERLPEHIADSKRKKKLIGISLISEYIHKHKYAVHLEDGKDHIPQALTDLLNHINDFFGFKQPIMIENTIAAEEMMINMLTDALTGKTSGCNLGKQSGRVIGYGAMGKVASRVLPQLKGTLLEPTELWDINGDSVNVKKPDFGSLKADDLLMVFPKGSVLSEIQGDIEVSGCIVMDINDIMSYIPMLKFPQLLTLNI